MKLDKRLLPIYAKEVMSNERVSRRQKYYKMWLMDEGGGKSLIEEKIKREFKDGEAIQELMGRLVPLNIFRKVINKLAGVYTEQPARSSVDDNSGDNALIEDIEDSGDINSIQKDANRKIAMFKKNLKENYLDDNGFPQWRNLLAHQYECFVVESKDKTQPDLICKIMVYHEEMEKTVLHWYTDESFYITNGLGEVDNKSMADYENKDGKNPIKKMPFVFTTSCNYSVDPIIDDDLLDISICLPIVITDLFFACKYMSFSMIYTIGVVGNLKYHPSSVVEMQYSDANNKPEIGSIKPTVDTDKVMKLVQDVLELFLSTKGISAGSIGKTSASEFASGISKMLDSADVVEGKKDSQTVMLKDENRTWQLLAKYTMPYWRKQQMLDDLVNRQFSKTFEISVIFKDPKAFISEKDMIAIEAEKLKNHFTSYRLALKRLYSDYTDDQIELLIQEIKDDQVEFGDLFNVQSKISDQPTKDIQPSV